MGNSNPKRENVSCCLLFSHKRKRKKLQCQFWPQKIQMQSPNTTKFNIATINLKEGINLIALVNKVVTNFLNHHIALSWSHWFLIDTKNQSLVSFLDGYSTRSLHKTILQIIQKQKYILSPNTLSQLKKQFTKFKDLDKSYFVE